MTINELRSTIGEHAKDIKLNLSAVLSPEGAPDLTQNQIYGIALSCAYGIQHQGLQDALLRDGEEFLSSEEILAAKSAASIMAMNNIYYRFIHLSHDKDYAKMPPNLRMNVIGKPGIAKVDFELYSLAVSAINGCGMCMDAHANVLTKASVSKVGIQSAIRIASVINSAAVALAL